MRPVPLPLGPFPLRYLSKWSAAASRASDAERKRSWCFGDSSPASVTPPEDSASELEHEGLGENVADLDSGESVRTPPNTVPLGLRGEDMVGDEDVNTDTSQRGAFE